jgi:hypothetical protein
MNNNTDLSQLGGQPNLETKTTSLEIADDENQDPAIKSREKRVKVAFFAAGSLLLLLLMVTIISSLRSRDSSEAPVPPTTAPLVPPLTLPEATPIVADLTQVYRNGRLGIVIQYPAILNLAVEEIGVETDFGEADEIILSDKTKDNYQEGLSVASIKIQVIEAAKNLDGSDFSLSDLDSVFEGSGGIITDLTRDTRQGKKRISRITNEKTGVVEGGIIEFYLIDDDRLIYAQGLTENEIYLSLTELDQILATLHFFESGSNTSNIECTSPRPEACTLECLANPPYLCGSNGKSYCSTCQACADAEVEWYKFQDTSCENS